MMVTEAQKQTNTEAFESMLEFVARQPNPRFALTDDFTLKSPVPVKGNWYIVGKCRHCGKMTPFCGDPAKGAIKFPVEDHFLFVDCSNCGETTRGDWANLKSLEWE